MMEGVQSSEIKKKDYTYMGNSIFYIPAIFNGMFKIYSTDLSNDKPNYSHLEEPVVVLSTY
jgi:hypothetical protein